MYQCLDRSHRLAYVLGEILELPGPEAAVDDIRIMCGCMGQPACSSAYTGWSDRAVSALTHAAVMAKPADCAGAATWLNHAVVRAAGVMAVAALGSIATPQREEFSRRLGHRVARLVLQATPCVKRTNNRSLPGSDSPG